MRRFDELANVATVRPDRIDVLGNIKISCFAGQVLTENVFAVNACRRMDSAAHVLNRAACDACFRQRFAYSGDPAAQWQSPCASDGRWAAQPRR